MPLPSATTAAPAIPPPAQPAPPPPAPSRRGNPNLALVPRCGARTRAGCACRAPAIHGKLRCRMHGGRSTGPRTSEGRARIAAARTIHGKYCAETRASNRHHVTFLRRSPVRMFAVIHRDRLPPDLAARMNRLAPELRWPPEPTRGITRAEDRAMLLAETAALAPWKQAMALDRQARREARAARAALSDANSPAQATPHAPERLEGTVARAATAPPAAFVPALQEAHAPIPATPAQPGRQPAPASTRVDLAPQQAPAGTGVRAAAEAHAPIRPDSARAAPRHPPGSSAAPGLAKPHAPERPALRASSSPAPAPLIAEPKPHAPNHAPATHSGSRTIPVGRTARRWLRQQKLMHRK
jgi:hypothetical protein